MNDTEASVHSLIEITEGSRSLHTGSGRPRVMRTIEDSGGRANGTRKTGLPALLLPRFTRHYLGAKQGSGDAA